MKKKPLEHVFVTFLDVFEKLPFGFSQEFDGTQLCTLEEDEKQLEKAEKQLFEFLLSLERAFGERLCYIGEDIIGEKFYKRFLFENGGFLEVMTGLPAAMTAHFVEKRRARRFSEALKRTLERFVREKRTQAMVATLVEVRRDDPLTVTTWNRIRGIRTEG